MILIISENNDYTTNDIIYWLKFFKKAYVRVNDVDIITIKRLCIEIDGTIDYEMEISGRFFKYSDISSVYYRRGQLNIHIHQNFHLSKNLHINYLIKNEIDTLKEFIHKSLEKKNSIGVYSLRSLNKLEVLYEAARCGLKIPKSYVLSSKEEIDLLLKLQTEDIITKHLYETALIYDESYECIITSRTYEFNSNEETPELFLYSLFQKNIIKDFEIRCFYLDGSFYSAIMLTQNNPMTKTDFRNYDSEKRTRVLPFQIPKTVESKLKKLFKKIGLNTGSVDMILSGNEFYFLEINPVGQYGMISYPCNFHLEKVVAEYLSR